MNRELESRQITETRSLLQKAGQRNAPQEIKRGALLRLIGLVHTSSTSLKIFAAQHFSQYFKDFPDLEEQVIHSVYDICEDTDSQVRIEGYKAIVSLSIESRKWTKRNTDVLVQLLQSDEPKELQEIEEALLKHIDLDPVAALGVLCDNCMLDPDVSRDEQMDKTRLRKLVLLFMSNTAKNQIFRHFVTDNVAEKVYREGLIKAIPDADFKETEIIVKDLLLPLRSFTSQSEYGDELLQVLLDKTKAIYAELKAQPGLLSLESVKPYLSLLDLIAIIKKIANPAPLLRFYSLSLIGKMALQKLDVESQMDIIYRLSGILDICEENRFKDRNSESSQDLLTLRNMVVDASPHLLERLIKSQRDDPKQWNTFISLMKACRQRQKEQNWIPPTNLITIIGELDAPNFGWSSVPATSAQMLKSLTNEMRAEAEKSVKMALPPKPVSSAGQKRKLNEESGDPLPRLQPTRSKSDSGALIPKPSTARTEPKVQGSSLLNRLQGSVKTNVADRDASSKKAKQLEHVAIPSPSTLTNQGLSIKGAATKVRTEDGHALLIAPNPTLMDRLAQAENPARKKRRK